MSDSEIPTSTPATSKRKLADSSDAAIDSVAEKSLAAFCSNSDWPKANCVKTASELVTCFEGVFKESEKIFKDEELPMTHIEVPVSQALASLAGPGLARSIRMQSASHLFLVDTRDDNIHRALIFHAGTSFIRALVITEFLDRFKRMMSEQRPSIKYPHNLVVLMFEVLEKAIVLSERNKGVQPTCRELAAMVYTEGLPEESKKELPQLIAFVLHLTVPSDVLRDSAGRSFPGWEIVDANAINELPGTYMFHTTVKCCGCKQTSSKK